jgi:succinate dehydrogenase / fumarate reductase, membrane anchor subunit
MTMRTPLKKVRHLGSAAEGADHFWKQRLTAVANLLLIPFLVGLLVTLVGADHGTVRQTLSHPIVGILLLLVLSVVTHMRLGMQVIIEDYVVSEGGKVALLILNTFFAIGVGLTSVFAVLKMSFGS